MSNIIIPSQTGLTLRRTDTLINLTHKLLAHTGVKGISQMSDDELWEWWLGVDDEWKVFFICSVFKIKEPVTECLYSKFVYSDFFNDCYFDYSTGLKIINFDETIIMLKENNISYNNKNNFLKKILNISEIKDIDINEFNFPIYKFEEYRPFLGNIDLKPLSNLYQLERLKICGCQIKHLDELSKLTNLKYLDLGDSLELYMLDSSVNEHRTSNNITDIKPLANLTSLTNLYLDNNQIQDIRPLSNLTQLTELDLSNNQIQDITPLANLTQLTELDLSENPIKPQNIEWLQQKLPNCRIEAYFLVNIDDITPF